MVQKYWSFSATGLELPCQQTGTSIFSIAIGKKQTVSSCHCFSISASFRSQFWKKANCANTANTYQSRKNRLKQKPPDSKNRPFSFFIVLPRRYLSTPFWFSHINIELHRDTINIFIMLQFVLQCRCKCPAFLSKKTWKAHTFPYSDKAWSFKVTSSSKDTCY